MLWFAHGPAIWGASVYNLVTNTASPPISPYALLAGPSYLHGSRSVAWSRCPSISFLAALTTSSHVAIKTYDLSCMHLLRVRTAFLCRVRLGRFASTRAFFSPETSPAHQLAKILLLSSSLRRCHSRSVQLLLFFTSRRPFVFIGQFSLATSSALNEHCLASFSALDQPTVSNRMVHAFILTAYIDLGVQCLCYHISKRHVQSQDSQNARDSSRPFSISDGIRPPRRQTADHRLSNACRTTKDWRMLSIRRLGSSCLATFGRRLDITSTFARQ